MLLRRYRTAAMTEPIRTGTHHIDAGFNSGRENRVDLNTGGGATTQEHARSVPDAVVGS